MRAAPPRHERDAQLALVALGSVFAITVGWWALALWPVPGDPEWLERARAVCFNAGPNGLPDASGWILLIGQPLGMFGFLILVWPRAVAEGLRLAASRPGGVAALALTGVVGVGGLGAAGVRVAVASGSELPVLLGERSADAHPRLDLEAPALGLVNQHGARVDVDELVGRPAIITFAFGNCHDICPLVVAHARAARDAVWGPEGASLVVVTLDPWRDTPSRLPSIAERWGLEGPLDHLLGGEVHEVETALDAWAAPRSRDPLRGDVAHPPLTYLLDPDGTIVFGTRGDRDTLVDLALRLLEPGDPPIEGSISF